MSHAIFAGILIGKSLSASVLATLFLLIASPLSLPALAQKSPSAASSPVNPLSKETDYTLGSGDILRVDIFQVKDLSGEYSVLVDGTVSFPLVGNLKVEGLTLAQLSQLLSQRYARYLKRPIVTVSLLAPRPLKIAISGEIGTPGSYLLTVGKGGQGEPNQKFPSLTDLIQQAGGLTTAADVSKVQIRRFLRGKQEVYSLNLWQLLQQGNQAQNITLRDGDTILIPSKEKIDPAEVRQLADANFGIQGNQLVTVAVIGEVYRPGSYKVLPEGTTGVIGKAGTVGTTGTVSNTISNTKGKPEFARLSQAIQLAGGIKPLANVREVEVRRLTRTGTSQIINIDLWQLLETGNLDEDIILQDGDTIRIPTAQDVNPKESEVLAAASFSPVTIRVNVVGEVVKPGVVEVPPNTPLNQAVLAAGGFDKRRADETSVDLIRLNPNGTISKRNIAVVLETGVDPEKNPPLRNNDVIVVSRSGLTQTTDTLNNVLSPFGSFLGIATILSLFGL